MLKNIKGKILFIKPFEIESSYSSFASIWKNIKRVLTGAEGIYDYALIRSVEKSAAYGFLSYSAWDSKISFSNAVKENTVLKYHISKNGEGKYSDYMYLYRVLEQNEIKLKKSGEEFLFINLLGENNDGDKSVLSYWKDINESLISKNVLQKSYICKSIYNFSKFRYVMLMSVKNEDISDLLSEHLIIKVLSNKYEIVNNYSSVYTKNLKINNIQTLNIIN